MGNKKKKREHSFRKWFSKHKYEVIAGILIVIIGGIALNSVTGLFSLLWNKLFSNNENTVLFDANTYFSPEIEFNIYTEIRQYPFAYEIEVGDKWDAFLKRGKELIDNDSSQFAIDFLTQMKSQYTNSALFYHILSIAFQKKDEFNIALDYINKSIEIDNSREWAYILRSSLYNTQENIDKAIDDIKIAIYLNKKNPFVWIMYGLTILKKWDVQAAEEFADSAAYYNADPFAYYDLKRLINVVAQNYELALAYDDSLELVRNSKIKNPHEFEVKARIYASNNRNFEALTFTDSCLQLDNKYVYAWTLKSLLYFRIAFSMTDSLSGTIIDSVDYLHKKAMFAADSALYYQNDNIDANYYKGMSLTALGYPKRAIPYFEFILKSDSSNTDAQRALNFANEYKNKVILDRVIID